MNKWLNVIFKMMLDGHSNETIYFYIREREYFAESTKQLEKYIYLIGKNNFPGRIPFNACYLMENAPEKMDEFLEKYTDGELAAFCNGIKRNITPVKNAISILKILDLLKEITTNSNSSNVLYMAEAD